MKQVYVSKITSSGQLSIPKEVRQALGIEEEYVLLEPIGDAILLRRVRGLQEELYEYFDHEAKTRGLTREDMERAIKSSKKKVFEEFLHGRT